MRESVNRVQGMDGIRLRHYHLTTAVLWKGIDKTGSAESSHGGSNRADGAPVCVSANRGQAGESLLAIQAQRLALFAEHRTAGHRGEAERANHQPLHRRGISEPIAKRHRAHGRCSGSARQRAVRGIDVGEKDISTGQDLADALAPAIMVALEEPMKERTGGGIIPKQQEFRARI